MTKDDVLSLIGDKLVGEITVSSRPDADLVLSVLRELGYRWDLLYTVGGNHVLIAYHYAGLS